MTEYCKHHLSEPAHFECLECGSYYCQSCISKRQGGYGGKETHFFCPSCNKSAEWIAASNVIRPFWERLHTFFVYPFKNVFTVLFMFGLSLVYSLFNGTGIIGFFMVFAMFILMMKYAFTAMAATARGALIPPVPDLKALSENAMQAFVPAFLTGVIVFLCIFITSKAGPAMGLVCLAFGFISLPAMIMSYMAGGSIIHALNPALFVSIMMRIGGSYFTMLFFLILLMIAPGALGFFLAKFFPSGLKTFLFSFANSYYTIIFYHLMGYVLLQYHREIGYKVEQEDFIHDSPSGAPVAPVPADPASQMLARIEFLAKEGKYDEALNLIRNETRGLIENPLLSVQYVKLLKMRNDPELKTYIEPHLKLMISGNNKKEACDAFLTCLSLKDVNIPAPSLIKLAGWLNESGAHKEAVSVYNKIITQQPDSHLVPMSYFRAGCILSEKLNSKDKADKIFRMLKSKYPMDDIIPHVDNYLKRIEATM